MKQFLIPFLFLVASTQVSKAQEMQYPLDNNPTIISYNLKHSREPIRTFSYPDTLSLPFVEDFSRDGIYATSDLWLDSGAFINSTFCDNPVTVGVATFDGIDKFGNRYSTSTARQYCDTLTSKPIRLAFAASLPDTTIWMSFYYQPQGLGIAPASQDSMLLLFKDSTGTWNRVWNKTGTTKQPFQRVFIHVNDGKYFFDGFQVRFMNYGPPNKNSDHWNYACADCSKTFEL